jgi:hypothetical protein
VVEHQGDAHQEQDQRGERDGAAHEQAHALLQPSADGPGADAEEQRRGEEDAERDQPQADQLARLRVVAAPAAAGGLGRAAPASGWGDLRADLTPPRTDDGLAPAWLGSWPWAIGFLPG